MDIGTVTIQVKSSTEEALRSLLDKAETQGITFETLLSSMVNKEELAADLVAMNRLHQLSTRLLSTTELHPLLEEVLDATMTLLNADFGNVQLYDPRTEKLKIVAYRGFQQEFLDYFNSVAEGTGSCGTALKRGERIIVEDVLTDPIFAPHLKVVIAAGYRAVQSTPLFSRNGEPLGMLSTHFRRPHRPSDRDLRMTDLYARQAAEMIERKRAEEERRWLLMRIVQAQEDERRRLSRELHDSFGQQLTSIRLGIETLRYLDNVQLGNRIDVLLQLIKQLDERTDFFIWKLRPQALDDLGLGSAIANFVEEWSRQFGITVNLRIIGLDDMRLSSDAETNLYRILQETLNNVLKHAQASQVDVILRSHDGFATLIVEDNGIGFDPRAVAAVDSIDSGLGLVSMRERVMLVGGTLEIESSVGAGTAVFVRIPILPAVEGE
jgi:signal transduction histidine kinase